MNHDQAKQKFCVALDGNKFNSLYRLESAIEELAPYVGIFKLGDVYTRLGYKAIQIVKKCNAKTFLDMKYHDTPNTVKNHAKVMSDSGVDMFTVHLLGGREMLENAAKGVTNNITKIIGVGPLTNTVEDDDELKYYTWNLVRIGEDYINGVVCRVNHLEHLKKNVDSEDLIYVTPGISDKIEGHQSTCTMPDEAIRAGSDMIVVGRYLTENEDHVKKAEEIIGMLTNSPERI